MTTFYVKVTPAQDDVHIDTSGTYPCITLTEKASQGRANTELIKLLSDILDKDVHIVSGHHSHRKELAADIDKDTIMKKLSRYEGS